MQNSMDDKDITKSMTISTENYEIVNTGSVVLQMGEFLEFKISNLKFRVVFINEESNDETPLEGRLVFAVENPGTEEAYYRMAFYNQSNAFLASISDFTHMGTIDGRPLKLKFSIQAINKRENGSDIIFFYTWYLAKEISTDMTNNVPQL